MEPPARANTTRQQLTTAVAARFVRIYRMSNGEGASILVLDAMKRIPQHQVKICTRRLYRNLLFRQRDPPLFWPCKADTNRWVNDTLRYLAVLCASAHSRGRWPSIPYSPPSRADPIRS